MTRENFDALCRACCSRKSISECLFADAEEGFIDTSAEGDGSRGIAFSRRKMMVNFDGTIKIVAYKKIRSVHIISSLEGAFADELEISGEHSRLRITDFSLDKHILKQIIEGLCEGIEEPVPEETSGNNAGNVPVYENKIAVDEENARENIENSEVVPEETSGINAGNVPVYEDKTAVGEEKARENAENGEVVSEETSKINAGNVPVYEDKIAVGEENACENAENSEAVSEETSGNNAENVPVYEDKITVGEEYARENAENSEPVPEETSGNSVENGDIILDYEDKIEWLSNSADTDIPDEKIEWLSSMTDEETAPVIPETTVDGESEMRDIIGQMSHEETLGYLSKTLGEINGAEPLHEENLPRKSTPETVPPSDDESEMREIIGQMSHEETLGFLSKTLGEINAAEPLHEENLPRKSTPETVPPSDDESEMRDIIGQMSHEETLGFLSKTLGEINGAEPIHEGNLPRKSDSEPFFPTTQTAVIPERPVIEKIAAQNPPAPKSPAEKPAAHEIPRDNGELSKEPVWGDIYIKASRSLRELCENGRLSMDIIENELRERLLDSARAFADIVKDEQKIPKVLIPKIAELKNAAEHFDEYFSHGEDVGVRVMFFMLYQMLSYSDRIAENPETKERLNDFFRRFGTAGITLSMLDVRG